MPADANGMTTRKRRHIDVCLDDQVDYSGVTTGLERYRLPYNALTQTSLAHIDLSTHFLGAPLRAPVLVGAMTGGAELSKTINKNLAEAAQLLGIGMMLGSQRIMLDSALGEQAASSFTVRDVAPDVLLFGNIGLAQLTDGCRRGYFESTQEESVRMRLRCIPIRSRKLSSETATVISPDRSTGCVRLRPRWSIRFCSRRSATESAPRPSPS